MIEHLPSVHEAWFNPQHGLRQRAHLTSPGMADMIVEKGGEGGEGGEGTLWMKGMAPSGWREGLSKSKGWRSCVLKAAV